MALLFPLFFTMRRLLIAFIIVGLPRLNWLQVQILLNLNIFSIIYQGWYRPYELPKYNEKELLNEVFIQLNIYFLIVYSDFGRVPEAQYTMGWVNIVCLAIMVVFNLLIMLVWQIKTLYRWSKLRIIKKKNERRFRMRRQIEMHLQTRLHETIQEQPAINQMQSEEQKEIDPLRISRSLSEIVDDVDNDIELKRKDQKI